MPRGTGREDLTGKVFGRLTALSWSHGAWLCLCSCGTTKEIKAGNLKTSTRSCGCLKKEGLAAKNVTHGRSGSPEYLAWFAMIQRCNYEGHPYYYRYGGRGIKVCERWLKFENFFEDMGPKPSAKHSLDRQNINEGYCRENCRWATAQEQAENKSTTVFLTFNGKTQAASAWARELGIPAPTIYSRVAKGWPTWKVLQRK